MKKLLTIDEFRRLAKDDIGSPGEYDGDEVVTVSPGDPQPVADGSRKIRFVFSDGTVDRAGDTIAVDGWDTTAFMKNPVALWAHDSWAPPIGRASNVGPAGGKLVGDIEFADADMYPFADTVYRLVSGGFLKAVSVGFIPIEWSYVNDKERPYGIDFKRQELLEISLCPVPCNANALMDARAKGIDLAPLRAWAEKVLDSGETILVPRRQLEEVFRVAKMPAGRRNANLGRAVDSLVAAAEKVPVAKAPEWKVGAARDLPLDESESWDGGAAAASIFEYAGGNDFDPAKARKGFLFYDASEPKLRGSYREPFAHVVEGTLKAVKGGIKAAASRLPQTDVSQSAKDEAQAVIDHYETRFGMGDSNGGKITLGEIHIIGLRDLKKIAERIEQATKAGRVLSAANEKSLRDVRDHMQAMHERGAKAMDLIDGVLGQLDPGEGDDTAVGDDTGGDDSMDGADTMDGGKDSGPARARAKAQAEAIALKDK